MIIVRVFANRAFFIRTFKIFIILIFDSAITATMITAGSSSCFFFQYTCKYGANTFWNIANHIQSLNIDGIVAIECFDPVFINISKHRFKNIKITVLTSEAEHKDSARIRMPDQITEDSSGIFLIIAHL